LLAQIAPQTQQRIPGRTGAGLRRSRHGGAATGAVAQHETAQARTAAGQQQSIAAGFSQGGMALTAVLRTAEAGHGDHSTHPS
jgi:predicted esterase